MTTAAPPLTLTSPAYTLTLDKRNGAITSLRDAARGIAIPVSSNNGCLWGSVSAGNIYTGGCGYAAGEANAFTYSWAAPVLTLRYDAGPGSAQRVNTTVRITASNQQYFEMQLTLENLGPGVIKNIQTPADLALPKAGVQSGVGPFMLPGVRLRQSFFDEIDRLPASQFVATYPSFSAFADLLLIEHSGSSLGLYTVNPAPAPIAPVAFGFVDNQGSSKQFLLHRSYHTELAANATQALPTVRCWIGLTAQELARHYRVDNGIDAYPSAQSKAGAKWQALRQAPLIKIDAVQLGLPFTQWPAELDKIPAPALIHPVAFQPGGHDHGFPDFLPPAPVFGRNADMRAMTAHAQARGLLVMPYTNPTWWHQDAPTLAGQPIEALRALALTRDSGALALETYSDKQGLVVSPYAPAVRARMAALMTGWRNDVPVDCVFEDQIGARPWERDFNPAAPTPLSYADGWLTHVALYKDRCLMTEMLWDRLARDELGAHGSLMTWDREFDFGGRNFGVDNWEPAPLAGILFHDKVLDVST